MAGRGEFAHSRTPPRGSSEGVRFPHPDTRLDPMRPGATRLYGGGIQAGISLLSAAYRTGALSFVRVRDGLALQESPAPSGKLPGDHILPFALSGLLQSQGILSVAHCDSAPSAQPPVYIRPPRHPFAAIEPLYKSRSRGPEPLHLPVLKPILQPFYARQLLTTTLRCTLLAYLPLLEDYLQQLSLEDDEEDEEEEREERRASVEPPGPEDLVEAGKRAIWSTLRELAVQVTRRLVERFVVKHVTPETGWHLTKDTQKSAGRIAERGLGRTQVFGTVFTDTFQGHILGCVASSIIQITLDSTQAVVYCNKHSKAIRSKPRILARQLYKLTWRIVAHAVKCVGALAGASAGAAAVTLFREGNWYNIGYTLGDMIAVAGVNAVMDPIIIKVQKELREYDEQDLSDLHED